VRVFSSDSATAKKHKTPQLKIADGMHRITWDLTYEGPTFVDGTIIWGYTGGVKAPPGIYEARLVYEGGSMTQKIEVKEDPRIEDQISKEDYQEQLKLGLQIRDAITEVHSSIAEIRSVKKQVKWLTEQSDDDEVKDTAKKILDELTSYEEQLMQTKNESGQDPIRFAPRLDNQLVENYNYVTGPDGYISGGREGRPNKAAYDRWNDLDKEWMEMKEKVQESLKRNVETFNTLIQKKKMLGVKLKSAKS
ncbi:MAG: hypothetical protein AAFO07_24990, partial [Bacteroidota bacterium]